MVGNWLKGAMTWTPAPGISNVIVSRPGLALASRIACRNESGPESFVFLTTKVVGVPGVSVLETVTLLLFGFGSVIPAGAKIVAVSLSVPVAPLLMSAWIV